MLDSMTPEQFDEWVEFYSLKPWGDDWLQAGLIASTVHNEIMVTASAFGGSKVSEKDLAKPQDFMPRVAKQAEKKTALSSQELLVWLRMQTGV